MVYLAVKHKDANKRRECLMLMSALRRLEISTAVFVIQEEKTEDARSEQEETGEHLTTPAAQNSGSVGS
jgi:hypothetical protein